MNIRKAALETWARKERRSVDTPFKLRFQERSKRTGKRGPPFKSKESPLLFRNCGKLKGNSFGKLPWSATKLRAHPESINSGERDKEKGGPRPNCSMSKNRLKRPERTRNVNVRSTEKNPASKNVSKAWGYRKTRPKKRTDCYQKSCQSHRYKKILGRGRGAYKLPKLTWELPRKSRGEKSFRPKDVFVQGGGVDQRTKCKLDGSREGRVNGFLPGTRKIEEREMRKILGKGKKWGGEELGPKTQSVFAAGAAKMIREQSLE